MEKIKETIDYINSKTGGFIPEFGIILGSGLGSFCDNLNGVKIPYNSIPNFPYSNVQGHKGELLFASINNHPCAIMQGRFHYYEGNSIQSIGFPVRVLKKLGIHTLFITNAAGALNSSLKTGDIVLIKDHINFMGTNPLIGRQEDNSFDRFPDMSNCYSEKYRNLAKKTAFELDIDLKEGVYIAVTGPSYETKAEVNAFRLLGGDVVGMSSVPEAIISNYLKLNTVAISLVTNYAAGVSEKKLSHDEVLEAGKNSGKKIELLIKKMIADFEL